MKKPKAKQHLDSYDLIIIGGGVSGLGAAVYAGRFKMTSIVISDKPGGTVTLTNDIENYPGIRRITGFELARKFEEHVKDYNIPVEFEKVQSLKKCNEGCFKVNTARKSYHALTIILATGTEWKKLGIEDEERLRGKGVHYCALCDGPFYKNKVVAVAGGSDSAAKEALLLASYAKKVYLLTKKDKLMAEPITSERIQKNKKVELITNVEIIEIKGENFLTGVVLKNQLNNKEKDIFLDGLFIDIGHNPLSSLVKNIKVRLNRKGEIMINRDSETNIKGVFAAGDVTDGSFKQAITGVAEGVTAAFSAYNYINRKQGKKICWCDDLENE